MRALFFALLLPSAALAEEPIDYERQIAPILRTYCAGCHNDHDLEGGLSVETFAQLRKGGDDHANPIVAGDTEKSFFVKVTTGAVKLKMPPKDEPQVPAGDLALLKSWIAAGAVGPQKDDSILRRLVVPSLPPSTKQPAISASAFSPDGKSLALARYATVEIRDTAANAVRISIAGLPGKVNAVHFSPDGTKLVVASGITGLTGVAQIRDAATGDLVREFAQHADVLYDAQFSPDGTLLATAGYDRVIRIWNAAAGTLLRSMDVHKGAVFALAFHPDGQILASASADETVKLWRVADGERLDTLNAPQGEQVAVAFTPDGEHVISAGADKRIHLWRVVSREKPALNPLVHSRFAHEAAITGMAISTDGKYLISTASDRSAKLWSLPDLELRRACEQQPDVAPVLAAVPNTHRFFVARMDGSTAEISVASDEQRRAVVAVASVPSSAAQPAAEPAKLDEQEPNDAPAQAALVPVPVEIKGSISSATDRDLFRFHAHEGESLVLETNAARSGSKLDSRVEVLAADGSRIEQIVLQATRDSWLTFLGKNSETIDDFRLQNWAQMELNEYLYANGEVVKLWLYPRGPDSGFNVYPGEGARQPAFFTTALAHPLGEPAYIVRPLPPGSQPEPNGLPFFHLYYENDDDPARRFGTDSVLHFTAPADGDYLARVSDVRGFGGEKDFHYTLTIRPRRPDFKVTVAGMDPKVSPGSGREFTVKTDRLDGCESPIRVTFANLPPGFTATSPVEIEVGQISALGVIFAEPGAAAPDDAANAAVKITASATIDGVEIAHDLGAFGKIELAPAAKLTVEIVPAADRSFVKETPGQPLEFTIHPSQTISAKARATRVDFPARIEFGTEGAGRNLPHGIYVDNLGLNGLLIVEGANERDFFITASPVAAPGRRMFHLKASGDGGQTSRPAFINVVPAEADPKTAANGGR